MLLALAALVTIFCGLVSVLLLYNHWQAARADRCPQANERKVLLWLEERGLRLPDPEEILALLQPSAKKLQPLEEGIVSCVPLDVTRTRGLACAEDAKRSAASQDGTRGLGVQS